MLRVLGRTSSINVRKVLWTLTELNEPFDHDASWAGPSAPASVPDFLELNPNGQVPVIVDENGVLWESNTICRYLVTRRGTGELLPAEPHRRARVEMWMDWQATDLNGTWGPAFHVLARKNSAFADAATVAGSIARWTAKMQILDDRLADTGGFVTGSAFTLADIVLGLSVHRYFSTPFAHAALPAVRRYVTRLGERDGFRRYATATLP